MTNQHVIRCRECRWPGECDEMHKCKLSLAGVDPNICGDDGPITPEQCALWLDAQYRRNGDLEDRAAAMWLRKLSARSVEPSGDRLTYVEGRLVRAEAELLRFGQAILGTAYMKQFPEPYIPGEPLHLNRSDELAWCAVCQARMPYPHEHQGEMIG